MKLILSNVTVIDPTSKFHSKKIDILIENGKISKIGLNIPGNKKINLEGRFVSPGFTDLFAHFNDPGFEQKEDMSTGSMCALSGGFTDVALIPNTSPVVETKSDVDYIYSSSRYGVDLWPIGAVSEGTQGENLTEMVDLHHSGVKAFSDGIQTVFNSELLLKALQYVQKFNGLIINRPKDRELSAFTHMHEGPVSTVLGLKGEPSISEELSVKRDLEILKYAGGRIHFTQLSSGGSVELIKKAKKEGIRVTCDVSIHHLLYTDDSLLNFDSNYKVDPPFRSEADRKILIKGLKENVIDAIVSAHQPQDPENKQLEFDLALPGIISLQTFYPNLLEISKEVPFDTVISKVTHGPRAILGLPEVRVEEGYPAKLTILDPKREWSYSQATNRSKSINSPEFDQMKIGWVEGVINKDFTTFSKTFDQ